ncbi:MAG: HAD family phosphatase [Natronospirillum sp.]|uniref:HAD family hydrolase n=1 Tax=Natronospirillum sp. TaxID=2812955 RepID=UPI0025EC45AA|nr:HAD family phosphatase [Natronospirillum sp.]MCH8551691.1 HAD family phosphatase [Natronospirillum sp.]
MTSEVTAAALNIDAVLFDCDGVLIDSETIATRSMHRTLQRAGLDYTEQQVAETFTGHSWPECLAMVEAELGGPLPDSFMADNEHFFNHTLREELTTMEGIETVLANLALPFAVVTNSRRAELALKLEVSGLQDFFPVPRRFDSETMGVAKPDPAIYRQAAERLQVDIRRCLVLEDSLPGLTAASQAGAVVWAYQPLVPAPVLKTLAVQQTLTHWRDFPAHL